MHIHILGIGGTFMGGVAQLAKAAGHTVTGADKHVYSPMKEVLDAAHIAYDEGYNAKQLLAHQPDVVLVGNALSRGNPAVEAVLDNNIPYTSGPQWLAEYLLKDRWVIAVSGTHGKTTTSSMVAWILETANLKPGFLIGGQPLNFEGSARLGQAPFFVIEADEYDTAFFDKRSKFVHYKPKTCIINNLEFDHADIFRDLAQIQGQFHQLVRTVPSKGQIIYPEEDTAITETLAMGIWSERAPMGTVQGWSVGECQPDGSAFTVYFKQQAIGRVEWGLCGQHNVMNGLAAIAASVHAGVPPRYAVEGLRTFRSVARRLEVKATVGDITIYDDFAHHPTAIESTLKGLREKVGDKPILAILDIRSNTMKQGRHQVSDLTASLSAADGVMVHAGEGVTWDIDALSQARSDISTYNNVETILDDVHARLKPLTQVLIMSNGSFDGLHERLIAQLGNNK